MDDARRRARQECVLCGAPQLIDREGRATSNSAFESGRAGERRAAQRER